MAGVYNDTDLAWLAGIIDGEGSILLSRLHKGSFRAPTIQVTNTTPVLLQECQRIAGKGALVKISKAKEHHSQAWAWRIAYNRALDVLDALLPFLKHPGKAARAKLLLTKYKKVTSRNGRYSPALLEEKLAFEAKFMSLS